MPSGALYSISGPKSDRGAIISVSGGLAPKGTADYVVGAPSIPFPVGFGANFRWRHHFRFRFGRSKRPLFYFRFWFGAKRRRDIGRVRCRPRNRTGSPMLPQLPTAPKLSPTLWWGAGSLAEGGGILSLQHRILQRNDKSSMLFRRGLVGWQYEMFEVFAMSGRRDDDHAKY